MDIRVLDERGNATTQDLEEHIDKVHHRPSRPIWRTIDHGADLVYVHDYDHSHRRAGPEGYDEHTHPGERPFSASSGADAPGSIPDL
jgi:hypothetical protein